jgi:hypothetical protein
MLLMTVFAITGTTGFAESDISTSTQEFHFSGNESTATESFTVEDGWEVHWKTEGASFQLSAFGVVTPLYEGSMTETEQIRRSFEVYQPIILADSSKTSGTAFHRRGGTFYLHVITSGPWNIHIITVKTTKDYLDVPYTGAP